ncbi:sensor histidine kinase [Thiohalophilus thiocyanatoxydans]|uniref:histidine kinase n=1 Tax=Thiohalophilus thiocyanatoxydans TaxID=381308 RepID=A0A4R8IKB7_9GAMM|nr:ATP-binding protein [Thiohalophilus thiocyanatoxydans]TDY01176.1 signal transduction histidine kinase [Thiohalophilus thiocyanatoxydans]
MSTEAEERRFPLANLDSETQIWQPLTLLNLYRLLIGGLFTALFYSGYLLPPLASHDATLFYGVALIYFAAAILFIIPLSQRWPRFDIQAYFQIGTDILATILLMHASGSISSGVGTLLIVTVAGGSIVMGGRHPLMFAALATLAVLGEQFYAQRVGLGEPNTYTQAGILGLTLFITALAVQSFARRIRESEALARRRGLDLANMSQLTEHIIQRMQTGVLVIDEADQIRLMNESAWYMLGMPAASHYSQLAELSPALATQAQRWQQDPAADIEMIQPSPEHPRVMPRFARIGQESAGGTLIFLEDATAMARHAQQLQLATLGRLTASIAHEIRNPLGAISHAGQLLNESPQLDEQDRRLTGIIDDQSRRMNTIVENIMQLSRRDRSTPRLIDLHHFLPHFVREFATTEELHRELIGLNLDPGPLKVRFDPSQLEQILTNLCQNAVRYSEDYPGFPKVAIHAGLTGGSARPFIDILDYGPGIDPEIAAHIFEPFYTTASSGTGLGLYISRELAEANRAHLNYEPVTTGGSCFRITFQDPRRQMD